MPISKIMYGSWHPKSDDGKRGGYWDHVYSHPQAVAMCGPKKDEIIKLDVIEDDNGSYWGFYDGEISMIWPSLIQLEMCFPYGLKTAEDCGKGKHIKLKIEKAQ